jgi:hypothetical protein
MFARLRSGISPADACTNDVGLTVGIHAAISGLDGDEKRRIDGLFIPNAHIQDEGPNIC